jgi:hypothetical protein
MRLNGLRRGIFAFTFDKTRVKSWWKRDKAWKEGRIKYTKDDIRNEEERIDEWKRRKVESE